MTFCRSLMQEYYITKEEILSFIIGKLIFSQNGLFNAIIVLTVVTGWFCETDVVLLFFEIPLPIWITESKLKKIVRIHIIDMDWLNLNN